MFNNYYKFYYDRKGRNGLKLVLVEKTTEPKSPICWGVEDCSVWGNDRDHYVVVDALNKESALKAVCEYLQTFGRIILRSW